MSFLAVKLTALLISSSAAIIENMYDMHTSLSSNSVSFFSRRAARALATAA